MFGPLNVFRSLPEASSTHSATAQQSPQGSSMKGLCAVVGIGTTSVLNSVLKTRKNTHILNNLFNKLISFGDISVWYRWKARLFYFLKLVLIFLYNMQ